MYSLSNILLNKSCQKFVNVGLISPKSNLYTCRFTHWFTRSVVRKPLVFQSERWTVTHLTAPTVSELSPIAQKQVGKWLLACSGMVFGTVILGGSTRLTKSGLSMVDWHLFKELPPFTQKQWEDEFLKYQQFPEFKLQNRHMTLSEFRFIWWMEYTHRTMGRLVGAAFYLPAAFFWWKGALSLSMKRRVVALGLLLGFQGLLGWYMVKSGLQDPGEKGEAHVSHYRLAAHLGTAFVLYSLLFWSGLSHMWPPQRTVNTKQMRTFWKCAHGVKSLVFLTALSGAFVAGLEAGLVCNTFPKMGDTWLPDDWLALKPKWRNFTENHATVQFDHRILGESVFCAVSGLWLFSRRLLLPSRARKAVNCLMLVALVQVGLGIGTLLLVVPKPLAAAHQAGALTLLTSAIWLTHELKLLRHIPK